MKKALFVLFYHFIYSLLFLILDTISFHFSGLIKSGINIRVRYNGEDTFLEADKIGNSQHVLFYDCPFSANIFG